MWMYTRSRFPMMHLNWTTILYQGWEVLGARNKCCRSMFTHVSKHGAYGTILCRLPTSMLNRALSLLIGSMHVTTLHTVKTLGVRIPAANSPCHLLGLAALV